jgi:hypothetical protein
MLGQLPALRRLDLSQNVLGKADVNQVAQVRSVDSSPGVAVD